jgi:hypothetical protein
MQSNPPYCNPVKIAITDLNITNFMKILRNIPGSVAITAGLICMAIYMRSLSCGFVNLDDLAYVVGNTNIRNFDSKFFSWAFGIIDFANLWMPLTWISFAIDYHFWGLNPLGYHLTNNLLHAFNTGLVVLIADKICHDKYPWEETPKYLYPAMLLLAGLLFGIHPLRVESVAWISERKDVLNGVFSLCSILCYLHYVRATESNQHLSRMRNYLFSLILFAMSLMSKPSSIFIPVLFLAADWYPLMRLRKGNIWPVLLEKFPFLVLSFAQSIMTLYLGYKKDALLSVESVSIAERLIISGNAIFEYLRLELFPVGILPYYAIPDELPVSFKVNAAIIALVICYCAITARKYPLLTISWVSFLLPLLPVLSIFQNGDQAFAARYTYLPSVMPGIVAAMFFASMFSKLETSPFKLPMKLLTICIICVVIMFGATTIKLIGVWKDTGTLWNRVIEYQPLGRLYLQLGQYYFSIGNFDGAIENFSIAIDAASRHDMPYLFNILAFRGEALRTKGRYVEAVNDFTAAINMSPHVTYYYYRGLALEAMGSVTDADNDFEHAGGKEWPLKWFWNKDGNLEE